VILAFGRRAVLTNPTQGSQGLFVKNFTSSKNPREIEGWSASHLDFVSMEQNTKSRILGHSKPQKSRAMKSWARSKLCF